MNKRPMALTEARARRHPEKHPPRRLRPARAAGIGMKLPGAGAADFHRRVSGLELDLTSLKTQNEQLLQQLSALRRAQQHFAALFERAPTALLLLNDYGAILEVNPAGRQLLELKRGKGMPEFFGQFVQRG